MGDVGNYSYGFLRQRDLARRTIAFPPGRRTSGHRTHQLPEISLKQHVQRVVFRLRQQAVSLTADSTLGSSFGSMRCPRYCYQVRSPIKQFLIQDDGSGCLETV